jgi:hypothetical protein
VRLPQTHRAPSSGPRSSPARRPRIRPPTRVRDVTADGADDVLVARRHRRRGPTRQAQDRALRDTGDEVDVHRDPVAGERVLPGGAAISSQRPRAAGPTVGPAGTNPRREDITTEVGPVRSDGHLVPARARSSRRRTYRVAGRRSGTLDPVS